jgi:flagellar hook protein FlgE
MNITANISSIQYQQDLFNQSAQRVGSSAINPKVDLAKEIPDQMIAQKSIESNIVAIKTDDEMMGTLIDMRA